MTSGAFCQWEKGGKNEDDKWGPLVREKRRKATEGETEEVGGGAGAGSDSQNRTPTRFPTFGWRRRGQSSMGSVVGSLTMLWGRWLAHECGMGTGNRLGGSESWRGWGWTRRRGDSADGGKDGGGGGGAPR